MLEDARSLIGDVASGKIKDARIALLADELKASDRKLSDALSENSFLKERTIALETQVAQFTSLQQSSVDDPPAFLEGAAYYTICALAHNPAGITVSGISTYWSSVILREIDIQFYIDEFQDWRFVQLARADAGNGPEYRLTKDGRAYYRRLEQEEDKKRRG